MTVPALVIDGKIAEFSSAGELARFVRKHRIDVEDGYEGCLY
jgi:hypothetical protein